MTDYRCKFLPSDRHCEFSQLSWQNMSAYLTNETNHRRQKLLMHLNWTVYNAYDLHIEFHVFVPDLVTLSWSAIPFSTVRGLSTRPVWPRSQHSSRNYGSVWCHAVQKIRHELILPQDLQLLQKIYKSYWRFKNATEDLEVFLKTCWLLRITY